MLRRTFELETDHKPLEVIFKPESRPCARIERWLLRLQSFKFVVKYRKGKGNIADPLSRLLPDKEEYSLDEESTFLVGAIMQSAAIDIQELEDVVKKDEELEKLRNSLQTNVCVEPDIKAYTANFLILLQ